jgi:GH35 family endo-1,4-beta-xylanase
MIPTIVNEVTLKEASSIPVGVEYVAQSYFQNIPAAQRFSITVWNLTDADSWIVLSGKEDFPTLFNTSYQKKSAYTGFLQGLK